MSSHYNTEPPPTASATLHTTVGPIHISLFAKQTPLACKNFLQHCLDGYYTDTTFHRIVPNFIVQAGDPTGTGSGGSSIYEDPEFELDYSRDPAGEKVVFKDEIHSRLKFNRRGLLGMAKSEDGSYGSQFFFTLAPADRELTGSCTMFGRVEGDSIFNVVKIAEAEIVEGTERPVYAVKITGSEVGELGPFEGKLKKREKVAVSRGTEEEEGRREREEAAKKKKKKKAKPGKKLLSFGDDLEELGDEGALAAPTKPKFNTKLVAGDDTPVKQSEKEKTEDRRSSVRSIPTRPSEAPSKVSRKRSRSPEPTRSPTIKRKPSRDPNTQIPLPDPESPRSPTPESPSSPKKSSLARTNAEIAALKASMRRGGTSESAEPPRKKTALEAMIPETSIRGRRRPPPGSVSATPATGNSANGFRSGISSQEDETLRMFNAFKSKLENADAEPRKKSSADQSAKKQKEEETGEDEEAQLCDLHFIANCQSCKAWDEPAEEGGKAAEDEDDQDWMSHRLTFAKDMLGKDLNWKRENEDADGLVVIDPRQKEKEIIGGRKREKERKRKMGSGGGREWDHKGRKSRDRR